MTEHQKPSIGRIVHYRLSEQDADHINRRRTHAAEQAQLGGHNYPVHTGNSARAGDVYPATVVRVFDPSVSTANLQVHLDGTDAHWATSRTEGDTDGQWFWPPRV